MDHYSSIHGRSLWEKPTVFFLSTLGWLSNFPSQGPRQSCPRDKPEIPNTADDDKEISSYPDSPSSHSCDKQAQLNNKEMSDNVKFWGDQDIDHELFILYI